MAVPAVRLTDSNKPTYQSALRVLVKAQVKVCCNHF